MVYKRTVFHRGPWVCDRMPDMCPTAKVTINKAPSFSDVRNIACKSFKRADVKKLKV